MSYYKEGQRSHSTGGNNIIILLCIGLVLIIYHAIHYVLSKPKQQSKNMSQIVTRR